jgi:(2S)-methylsuccinyl-CoA dehydrogenase
MSLAAARTDSGTGLVALMAEAKSAADALLADAVFKVREQVAVAGRIDPRRFEAAQRATHGLAWFATYAEAIRQLSN